MKDTVIQFRKFKGSWFAFVSSKGYKFYKPFNEFLSSAFDQFSSKLLVTKEKSPDSVLKVDLSEEKGKYRMNLYDISTGELKYSGVECPHLVKDLSLNNEFYVTLYDNH